MSLKLKILIWIIVGVCLLFSITLPLDHDPERSFFDSLFGVKGESKEVKYHEEHISRAQSIAKTF